MQLFLKKILQSQIFQQVSLFIDPRQKRSFRPETRPGMRLAIGEFGFEYMRLVAGLQCVQLV